MIKPINEPSILNSIKLQLGIPVSHTEFDSMLIMDINTAFSMLHQVGVGPKDPYMITGYEEQWDSFIVQYNMEMAKQFIALKVRELFDPPASGTAAEAMKRNLDELIWRLSVAVNEDEREGSK